MWNYGFFLQIKLFSHCVSSFEKDQYSEMKFVVSCASQVNLAYISHLNGLCGCPVLELFLEVDVSRKSKFCNKKGGHFFPCSLLGKEKTCLRTEGVAVRLSLIWSLPFMNCWN